jgi:hypothetical protein
MRRRPIQARQAAPQDRGEIALVFTSEEVPRERFGDATWVRSLEVAPVQRVGETPPTKYLTIVAPAPDATRSPIGRAADILAALPDGEAAVWLYRVSDWVTWREDRDARVLADPFGTPHVFLALTNAVAGREPEFNAWYDDEHVPDVVSVPGFVSGRRLQLLASAGSAATATWQHLALYQFEGDLAQIHHTLIESLEAGEVTLTDAIDDFHVAWVYTQDV